MGKNRSTNQTKPSSKVSAMLVYPYFLKFLTDPEKDMRKILRGMEPEALLEFGVLGMGHILKMYNEGLDLDGKQMD